MSTFMRTRDGSHSVANAMLADERASTRYAQIDMQGAIDWAKAYGLKMKGIKRPVAYINAHREKEQLPPFKIVRRLERKEVSNVPQPAPTFGLLALTEEALLQLAYNHYGTITGLVTPEIAGWLLKLNIGNRNLTSEGVERFRRILKSGDWVNTGEPLIVAREAILNDGQHRLTAICSTGIAGEIDVRFGLPRDVFKVTGTGRRRTVGQILGIKGLSNTSCQAAITRLLYHYDNEQMSQSRGQVETSDIMRMLEADNQIGEIAAKVQRSKLPMVRTGSFGFVLVVAARTAPIESVFAFVDLVTSGLTKNEDDPARKLHEKFVTASITHNRLDQIDIAAMTVRAWNAYAEGRSLKYLKMIPAERTSDGFPKVAPWRPRD